MEHWVCSLFDWEILVQKEKRKSKKIGSKNGTVIKWAKCLFF